MCVFCVGPAVVVDVVVVVVVVVLLLGEGALEKDNLVQREMLFRSGLCTFDLAMYAPDAMQNWVSLCEKCADRDNAHLLLRSSSTTSTSSTSSGLKYSATMAFSSCSRSGFSMNLTVPSRPRSPILPRVPLAMPGVEGDAVLGDSLGEVLVPFNAFAAPFVVVLWSFHSVNRGRCLASISWFNGIRTSRKMSTGKSGPTVVLFL